MGPMRPHDGILKRAVLTAGAATLTLIFGAGVGIFGMALQASERPISGPPGRGPGGRQSAYCPRCKRDVSIDKNGQNCSRCAGPLTRRR